MTLHRKIALVALAATVALAGLPGAASAQKAASTEKKVTLQQAWKICKERVDKRYGSNTTSSNMNDRYLLGAACMHEHGFNI